MKEAIKLIMFTLLVSLPTACSHAQTKTNDMTPKEEIEAYLDVNNKAMVEKDTATLGSLMSDNLVLHHMSGQAESKQDWLKEIATGSMQYHKIRKENLKVQFNDNNTRCHLTCTSVITATIWGMHGTWNMPVSMTLEKRNGKWVRINP